MVAETGKAGIGEASLKQPIYYESEHTGSVEAQVAEKESLDQDSKNLIVDLARRLAPIVRFEIRLQVRTLEWLEKIHSSLPGKNAWVGIYWIESFVDPKRQKSTDLVVGPYIGPATPHVRIGQDAGLCGLAVRERRTVNVEDVRADPRFLACSTTTRSEIVIPIQIRSGQIVGELDIDSNELSSFTAVDQRRLEQDVILFGQTLK